MLKQLLGFIPAKWKLREEVKARGEGHLAIAEQSLDFWVNRLGWSPAAARYLATAFAFGIRENVAAVLEKAEQLSPSEDFEHQFMLRAEQDPSVIGPALEASRFINAEELRDLLGRILAEEVSESGSVSSRAVSIARDLSPTDLREFLKLRAVAWRGADPADDSCFLVLGKTPNLSAPEFLSFGSVEVGVNYHTFGDLQSLGLLQERPHGILLTLHFDGETVRFSHGKRTLSLRPTDLGPAIGLGMYDLTNAGKEIMRLYLDEECPLLDGYFEEVSNVWRAMGFEVEEVIA